MKQSCDGCFYYNQEKQQEPCYNCHSYCNWVSKDFLNSVPDTPVTLKTGVKFDQEKPQWTLVPFKAFDHVVEVLTIGAKKYAPDNWKKVPNARQRYIDAAFRHMSAYAGGEKLDAETGKNHLAHAVCCLLFLLAFDLDSSLEKTND
jgi:lysine/ornithine N-monooxygenase